MDQNIKDAIGWPLDELQKGEFNYDNPKKGSTLSQYAESIRNGILRKEQVCQVKKK